MTGSVNAGMQQGTYGNQFLGFNLNNNDGKNILPEYECGNRNSLNASTRAETSHRIHYWARMLTQNIQATQLILLWHDMGTG